MAQPLSDELTHCPLVGKARRRRKRECAGKIDRARTREDFLTNVYDSNLIFPQAASLNLSEFKFNEKYPAVHSGKSVAATVASVKPVASAPKSSDKLQGSRSARS